MRISQKAFLSCAVVAGMGLLVAPEAMAADPPPAIECDTTNGYHIKATGPSLVACGADVCTEIVYEVSAGAGTPDHVAILLRAEAGVPDVAPPEATWNISDPAVCAGDSALGIGGGVICHERIVRINNQSAKSTSFGLTVQGSRSAITTSVVVKKGKSNMGACAIVGIGLVGSAVAPVTEILKHGECAVEFTLDKASGTVLKAELTPDSPTTCKFYESDVRALNMTTLVTGGDDVNGCTPSPTNPCPLDLPDGRFGDGYVHSGNSSCTTRVIGGKVYTWGSPCPQ